MSKLTRRQRRAENKRRHRALKRMKVVTYEDLLERDSGWDRRNPWVKFKARTKRGRRKTVRFYARPRRRGPVPKHLRKYAFKRSAQRNPRCATGAKAAKAAALAKGLSENKNLSLSKGSTKRQQEYMGRASRHLQEMSGMSWRRILSDYADEYADASDAPFALTGEMFDTVETALGVP